MALEGSPIFVEDDAEGHERVQNVRRLEEAGQKHSLKAESAAILALERALAETPIERSPKIELPPFAKVETASEPATESVPERRADTLSRAELLELGGDVVIDGTSLRQMYEGRVIGERGLRRLVAEHLRGGDVREALRQEIMEHERDFERDPAMRDVGAMAIKSNAAVTDTSDKTAAADPSPQKTDAGQPDHDEQTISQNTGSTRENTRQRLQRQKRIIDISLVAVIAVLAILVIVLYLLQH